VAEPVPLHLRNAPTRLMKSLGYGEGYRYAHDEPDAVSGMDCLPPRLAGRRYYEPTGRGYEHTVRERLTKWMAIKKARQTGSSTGGE
jgi:putative ATPase